MAAGSIIIDLLMRTGAFETDTKRAEARLKGLKKEADAAGKAIGAAFVVVGAATVALVKSQIDAADAAGKSAAAAGVSVEAWSSLAYAAELAGVETSALSVALNTLNKSISGNDKSLQALGINVRDAAGNLKNAEAVLSEVADSFEKLPAGPRKSQLALDLFGKSGAKLIPLLNQGSAGIRQLTEEARRLGVVIDEDTARAAEEFNDNMTRLQATGRGLGIVLAKEVLPFITDLSTRALKNAKDFGLLRGSFVALYEVLLGGTEPADLLARQSLETAARVKGLREEITKLTARGTSEDFQGGVLAQLREELRQAEAEAKRSSQAIADALNAAAGRTQFGRGKGFVDPRLPRAPDAPDEPKKTPRGDRKSEAQRYLETLQKQADALEDLSSREQALREISSGRLAGLTPALERAILKQAELNDASRQAAELRDSQVAATSKVARANLENLEALQQSNEALRQEIALIGLDELGIIGVERARVSSLRALKEETRAKQEAAGVSEQQLQVLDAEIAALREREELLGNKIQRGLEERSKESAERTGADVRDALGDSIEAGILDGFRRGEDLADIFLRELKAQFARTILRPIIQPIADAGNSLLADILGAIGASFGGSGGGAAGPDSRTGEQIRARRASGGRIYAGGDVLVGEKGPERIRPVTAGSVLPNDRLTNGNAGGRPQVIVNTPPGVQVERQESSNDGRKLELWLAGRVADGSSPLVGALRNRGVNTSGNLPRRQR